VDRHKIWRIVRGNLQVLRDTVPEGYTPVVDVFLVSRREPVRLGQVETSRDPAFPWTLLIPEAESGDETTSPADHCRVFVLEQYIERVEIRFVRSERGEVGFSHRILDDGPSESTDE
jgi:hypothetical protein